MSEPRISIVVPVYKVEKYLDRCVESIVNQTYNNLEIILVDDGSPDNCPKMCDEWAKRDDRIQVIHKVNGGLSDARNAGLDIMTGDYVMFVDSDDFIDKEMCYDMLNLSVKEGADICCCNYFDFYENVPFKKNDVIQVQTQIFKGEEVIGLLFNKKLPLIMVAWCKLYKAEIFKELRFEVGRYHEDEFMIHHTLSRANVLVYTNKKYYNYLKRTGSITSKISNKNIEDSLEAFSLRYEFLNARYKDKQDLIKLHYMGLLRNLYVLCQDKTLKNRITNLFKNLYRESRKKDKKDKIFNYMPKVYTILTVIYNKLHG